MGRLISLLVVLVGCVQPTFTKCPDVDCPQEMVCDGHGGCALPDQLAQCSGKADGTSCMYTDRSGVVIAGACNESLCLPLGCGNSVVTPNEICDDGNTVNGDGCSADCQSNETCGNGVVDPAKGEQCDDGNLESGDGCQADCKNPRCGDGVADTSLNEDCDVGMLNSTAPDAVCRPNCQAPQCGDGVRDPLRGEICDDGNNNPADGCAGDCKSDETCGNSVVDVLAGELCDDGNTTSGDGCAANCLSIETCGNNILDSSLGEICDDANTVSGDGCSSDCRSLEVCGNQIVDTISEQCDLGDSATTPPNNSNAPNSTCRTTCQLPKCGDAIVDNTLLGEACDLGTATNSNSANATCRTNCQPQRCGDLVVDFMKNEVCDDGNLTSGDNCSADCRSNETCGNSYVDVAKLEQCDAGSMNANAPNASCRTDCKLARCGDSIVDNMTLGEGCDQGASNSGAPNAACRANCQPRRCGDMVIDNLSLEVCDDGNTASLDGCSPDCRSNETCGNGIVDVAKGEQCDAGASNSNLANAACRTNCTLPRCGDGAADTNLGEACDAGASNANTANAVCRTNCQVRRCGDTVTDNLFGEVCDDGNATAGDNCSPDCTSNETCGNGIVDVAKGEQCDAGVANSSAANAPCRTNCTLPRCGDGAADTNRGEACDAGAANANTPNAACRTNCQPRRCGDLVIDNLSMEVCDDGNVNSGDNCSADCRSNETCRNGYVDTAKGEQCDDNNAIDNDFCHNNCTLPRCGDSIVDFNEQCDNGAANSNSPNAACRTNCLSKRCGDTIVDTATEACDDGNLNGGDGCRPDCLSNESCGNGILDSLVGELCDDANAKGRDGCSGCKTEDAVILTPGQEIQFTYLHSMAYDAARQKVVLFDGQGGRETWEWDGVAWTQMLPRTSPPSRTGQGMAYDPIRKRVVMFGGFFNSTYRNDTWEWDGNEWTERVFVTKPAMRDLTSMAFDANRKAIVLYGGTGPSINYSDTWEYNGTAWTLLTTTGTPGIRYAHRLVWDGARNNLLLYGGSISSNRAWTFNGTTSTWTDRGLAPAGTPAALHLPMAYDPNRAVVVLWHDNGITHEWNGTTWSTVASATATSPTAQPFVDVYGMSMVYDAARGQLVLAGGYGTDTGGGATEWNNTTWLRTGTAWLAKPAWTSPGIRYTTSGAYDPVRGKFVVFGGGTKYSMYDPVPNATNDTWEWDGRKWTLIAATTPPSLRSRHWMDYNRTTGQMMLFGGVYYDTADILYADLYGFNATTSAWATATNSAGRSPIRMPAMAYDITNNKVVTFGGMDATYTLTQNTHTWDATAGWVLHNPAMKPSPRSGHALGYDPVRRRTVLFGGVNGQELSDTWEWDGTNWLATGASGPDARKGHSMFYNPDVQRMQLYGNAQQVGSDDLWEWSGTTWTQRRIENPVAPNYRAAEAFFARTHEIVFYGGRDNTSATTATKLLRYRPYVTTEACLFSTIDYDLDGLAGCADPDCWSVCTPLCPPGATGCPASPRCGDGTCGPLETCDICPGDCTVGCPAAQCGDFRCRSPETNATCPSDCYQ